MTRIVGPSWDKWSKPPALLVSQIGAEAHLRKTQPGMSPGRRWRIANAMARRGWMTAEQREALAWEHFAEAMRQAGVAAQVAAEQIAAAMGPAVASLREMFGPKR